MSELNFSEEELNLIKYYSVRQSTLRSLVFYFCVLAAPVGFAFYGVVNQDSTAILVAFTGLLVFIVWYISASMKNEKTINSIFNKILKSELSK